jgi:DNA-binding NarL/FixJ family response regulator
MNDNNKIGSKSNAKTPAGGLNVLLVEDSILMRAHVVSSLSAIKGVGAIRQAGDVPSGLRLLETLKPDVLILDIELPGQTGLDLLKIVRKKDAAVVIIILTNHDHPMLRQKCADLGANFYFNKLTEFERVAEVCHELAARRAQQASSSPHTAQE